MSSSVRKINLKTSKCPLAHPLSPCLLMKEIEEDVFFLQIKSLFQL